MFPEPADARNNGSTSAQLSRSNDLIKYDPNKDAAIMDYGWIHPTQFCGRNMQESSRSFFFSSCKLSICVCNRASLATVGTRRVLERNWVGVPWQWAKADMRISVDVRVMHSSMQILHNAYCHNILTYIIYLLVITVLRRKINDVRDTPTVPPLGRQIWNEDTQLPTIEERVSHPRHWPFFRVSLVLFQAL